MCGNVRQWWCLIAVANCRWHPVSFAGNTSKVVHKIESSQALSFDESIIHVAIYGECIVVIFMLLHEPKGMIWRLRVFRLSLLIPRSV